MKRGHGKAGSPRLSLSSISSRLNSFDQNLALWEELEVSQIGLATWETVPWSLSDATVELLKRGYDISSLLVRGFDLAEPESWPITRAMIDAAVDSAAEIAMRGSEPPIVSMLTGRNYSLPSIQLLELLNRAVSPSLLVARDQGVTIALEPTVSMRSDVSSIHTVLDAAKVARALGTKVNVDLYACWTELDIRASISQLCTEGLVALIQISDHARVTTASGDRAVPGDGCIPLAELVAAAVSGGYVGTYELESMGPTIDAEGYSSALRRGLDECCRILVEAGAAAS